MAFSPEQQPLQDAIEDGRAIRIGLIQAGVPRSLIHAIATRALRSGRRLTGPFRSNRNPRWELDPADPQYGTELDSRVIYIRLLGMLLEFRNAPTVGEGVQVTLAKYLGHRPETGRYRDVLTLESIDYDAVIAEAASPVHGLSSIHIGHEDPTARPRHTPSNVSWRTHRSNLIQGDLTLRDARAWVVALIARYFELGEVKL